MNDTTACLAYGAYSDYDAMIGAVIGELTMTPIVWYSNIFLPRLRRLNRLQCDDRRVENYQKSYMPYNCLEYFSARLHRIHGLGYDYNMGRR